MNTMKNRPLPKVMTASEEEALLSVIDNERDRAAIGLGRWAGLRAHEIATLEVGDIDVDLLILRVKGKGGKHAEVAISNRLWDMLDQAIRKRPLQATHEFFLWDKRNPEKGIKRQALNKMLAGYCQKAGIRHVTVHMLRHSFLTNYFREIGDLGKVQKAARHSKIETTTIYTHLTTEDQRKDLNALDHRSWIKRKWSKMRPKVIPDFIRSRQKPISIGEIVGRTSEISRLRTNLANHAHSVLIGERGLGKKTLLESLVGVDLYRLESLSPARENLVGLCTQLHLDGLLEEMPKGRSTRIFEQALMEAGKAGKFTLVIESLSEVNKSGITILRKLAKYWTIFTSIEPSQKSKAGEIFFGNFDEIPVKSLSKQETYELARKASADLSIPDQKAYCQNIFAHSEGNPQAILEMVDITRRTGELYPTHSGVMKVLPATPLLSMFMMMAVLSRYSASSLSKPDLKVYVTLVLFGLMPPIVLDRILKLKGK
jgi:hypothetical protein